MENLKTIAAVTGWTENAIVAAMVRALLPDQIPAEIPHWFKKAADSLQHISTGGGESITGTFSQMLAAFSPDAYLGAVQTCLARHLEETINAALHPRPTKPQKLADQTIPLF
jgi:hypothetical protein